MDMNDTASITVRAYPDDRKRVKRLLKELKKSRSARSAADVIFRALNALEEKMAPARTGAESAPTA